MKKPLEPCFICCIRLGLAVLLYQNRLEWKARAEHSRLSQEYGDLVVEDRTRFKIQRIETNDSKHFLWHLYLPLNTHGTIYVLQRKYGGARTESYAANEPSMSLVRCRFEYSGNYIKAQFHATTRFEVPTLGAFSTEYQH